MTGKNYTVMELAEQIGVPRTTINDWLGRYSQYIDTVAQGKRKVYPESALNVLREVAALRTAGKAFAEIESELSAKHPIRAVPVPPQEEGVKNEVKSEARKSAEPAGETASENSSNPDGFAVIARKQSEEIGRILGESFRNMDQRIQELEKLSAAQHRLAYFRLAAGLLLLLILSAAGYLTWRQITEARKENMHLRQQQRENTVRLTALKEQSVSLIAGNKTFQANIARLESELKQQKKDFEKNIEMENRRLTELHKAQEKALLSERDQALMKVREQKMLLELEKEKFAAERLKLLKALEELKKNATTPPPPAGKEVKPEKKIPSPAPVSAQPEKPSGKTANSAVSAQPEKPSGKIVKTEEKKQKTETKP